MQTNGIATDNQAILPIGTKREIKIVIGGYYGFSNLGDEAILSAMIVQIRQRLSNVNIVVVSGNPAETERMHGIHSIDKLDIEKIEEEVSISDLVILGGGGLFQSYDIIQAGHLFEKPNNEVVSYALLPLLAKMHNKPVLFYSQGFGPLSTKEARTFTAFISGLADHITVRDNESIELLRNLGISGSKIQLSADPALCIDATEAKKDIDAILSSEGIPRGKEIIIVSIRWWIDKSSNEWLKQIISDALDRLLDKDNRYIVIFVPFQVLEGASDLQLSDAIIREMRNKDRCFPIKGCYHPADIVGLFSRASLVIGMRYHSLIFSLISNTPFISISYADKVRDLTRELAMDKYCIDLGSANSSELLKMIDDMLANSAQIKDNLRVSLIALKMRSAVAAEMIVPCIHNSLDYNDKAINADKLNALLSEVRFLHDVYYDLKSQLKDSKISKVIIESKLEEATILNRDAEARLKKMESELSTLNNKCKQLSSTLQYNEIEANRLKETVRQMESSISWRFSQYYGRFFNMKSPVTRTLRGTLNRVMPAKKSTLPELSSSIPIENDVVVHERELDTILREHEGKIKGIIVYPPTVDWNIPLFQRPQQLALELSRCGYLFFFSTGSNEYDKVNGFQKVQDRCYVTNQYDLLARKLPDFILMISSTNLVIGLDNILKLRNKAFIVYEYIDEIHEDISGSEQIKMMISRHDYMIENADVFIATADNLYHETLKKRAQKTYLIPNGVDYAHFHIKRDPQDIPPDLAKIMETGKPIIGYYGALAKWFDYELVKKVAISRPDYELILIGWNYDNSMKDEGLDKYSNIHYLGIKEYPILPKYAVWFDVSTIPFVLNKITESTSPIKVFEYMALQTPIVTTDLKECRKYKSILIGKDSDDFVKKIDEAMKLRQDSEYLKLLEKEAMDNTWKKRATDIASYIEKYNTTLDR